MNNDQPDWTILIYANGNNELAPETWQAKLAAEQAKPGTTVKTILQIGLEKQELVKIMRPNQPITEICPKWTGARRFEFFGGRSTLIKNLGRANMADPRILYDFIHWGLIEHPANRTMLVLSGHGYQFVGTMPDYSQKCPYIMGLPEMCAAIHQAVTELGRPLDILVLDICYANFIELLYELAKYPTPPTTVMMTYIKKGPIEGLHYGKLLELISGLKDTANLREVVIQVIEGFENDLVAFYMDHARLERIKEYYNTLAMSYIYLASGEDVPLHDLLDPKRSGKPWDRLAAEIQREQEALILHHKRVASHSPLLNVANGPTDDASRLKLYERLSFTWDNEWYYLLSKRTLRPPAAVWEKPVLEPMKLQIADLYSYISIINPGLSDKARKEILADLFRYKKWLESTNNV